MLIHCLKASISKPVYNKVYLQMDKYTIYRKQLATLNYYMKNVAKQDVMKLCEHTRELMYELNAAGETTNDLLADLMEALKEAPDNNFQRWLSNQVDL
jgi:hypothetical protein